MKKEKASREELLTKISHLTDLLKESEQLTVNERTKRREKERSLVKLARELKKRNDNKQDDQNRNEEIMQTKLSSFRVTLLGAALILFVMAGFYTIPGLIAEDAEGDKFVNAFYCSVISLTTIGFGDICPGETDIVGQIFLTLPPLFGLGFFCGPILELASSWQNQIPGGVLSVGSVTLAIGVSVLTALEGYSISEAIHLCVMTGTTIGYGNISPSSNAGRIFLSFYAMAGLNVMGGILDISKTYLEAFCMGSAGVVTLEKKTE